MNQNPMIVLELIPMPAEASHAHYLAVRSNMTRMELIRTLLKALTGCLGMPLDGDEVVDHVKEEPKPSDQKAADDAFFDQHWVFEEKD